MRYEVQQWDHGRWRTVNAGMTLTYAAEILMELDVEADRVPRRVTDPDGATVFSGRHCPRDTPVNDIKPLWIVMSLDKPGPCERDGEPYHQHPTKHAALAEARRLSASCGGGRFGVLELVHVTGWVNFDLADEIPF